MRKDKTEEQKSLAFFPWFTVSEVIDLGQYELVPVIFDKPKLPSDEHFDIKNVLSFYEKILDIPVDSTTVLRRKNNPTTKFLEKSEYDTIFSIAELVTFSGLSMREFFTFAPYSNASTFSFVIQNFKDSKTPPSTTSRRRDGKSLTGYATGKFKEICPRHSSVVENGKLDKRLLSSLIKSLEDETSGLEGLFEAASLFNLANTDGTEVRDFVEVILMTSAFERLHCNKRGKEDDFIGSLTNALKEYCKGNQYEHSKEWKKQYQKSPSIIDAWARDFFRLRGDVAHGNSKNSRVRTWLKDEHLLHATFVFPLLAKVLLSSAKKYEMTEEDEWMLRAFEELLSIQDPFGKEDRHDPYSFHWSKVFRKYKSSYLDGNIILQLMKQWSE